MGLITEETFKTHLKNLEREARNHIIYYIKETPTNSKINDLVFNFIRSLGGYTGPKWNITAGYIDLTFKEYVKNYSNDLYAYFAIGGEVDNLTDGNLEGIDFRHLCASLDGMQQGTMPDSWCTWAGDLGTAIIDTDKVEAAFAKQGSYKSLLQCAKMVVGAEAGAPIVDNIKSSCSSIDLRGDADAIEINKRLDLGRLFSEVIEDYYNSDYKKRFKLLYDDLGGDINFKDTVMTQIHSLPLLVALGISHYTKPVRDAVAEAFIELMEDKWLPAFESGDIPQTQQPVYPNPNPPNPPNSSVPDGSGCNYDVIAGGSGPGTGNTIGLPVQMVRFHFITPQGNTYVDIDANNPDLTYKQRTYDTLSRSWVTRYFQANGFSFKDIVNTYKPKNKVFCDVMGFAFVCNDAPVNLTGSLSAGDVFSDYYYNSPQGEILVESSINFEYKISNTPNFTGVPNADYFGVQMLIGKSKGGNNTDTNYPRCLHWVKEVYVHFI